MTWILLPFHRAFDYSGRSRRREYWLFALTMVVLTSILGVIADAIGLRSDRGGIGGLVSLFVLLALLLPGLGVGVRRLHDSDHAGWWLALPIAPIVAWAVVVVLQWNAEILFRITMAAMILAPVALIVLLLLPGTAGPNRFGPDPKAGG